MAGIYIHVPFCKTRCIYCDFYSTTHSELKERYLEALCKELEMRREYLKDEQVETIYFGGGTPSQLSIEDFERVFATIGKHFEGASEREITLEANPDDLTPEYLKGLATLPFNRISMGIQTFDPETLHLLNRRHTAPQAIAAVGQCREAGFRNISIDLIYGLPGETLERWEQDLKQAIDLDVEHLSAYHLTYEKGTPIYRMLQKKQVSEVTEESSISFFTTLIDQTAAAGYDHYEISNFCRPGLHARHNTSYWQGISYLGCGPSAHSFNQTEREWNVASLHSYLQGIETGQRVFEQEHLNTATQYNDFVITSLRTRQGVSLDVLKQKFGIDLWQYCLRMATTWLDNGALEEVDSTLRLTRQGLFISDSIMSDLLYIEE